MTTHIEWNQYQHVWLFEAIELETVLKDIFSEFKRSLAKWCKKVSFLYTPDGADTLRHIV